MYHVNYDGSFTEAVSETTGKGQGILSSCAPYMTPAEGSSSQRTNNSSSGTSNNNGASSDNASMAVASGSKVCMTGQGSLPSCAPYAVPIVAAQSEKPGRYSKTKALENGTLFPCLNLPFHLKVNATELADTPLNQLRALEFVLLELGLYLDTHPHDEEAFSLFQTYTALEKAARDKYVEEHGPLLPTCAANDTHFTWINGPWPWDYPEGEA